MQAGGFNGFWLEEGKNNLNQLGCHIVWEIFLGPREDYHRKNLKSAMIADFKYFIWET